MVRSPRTVLTVAATAFVTLICGVRRADAQLIISEFRLQGPGDVDGVFDPTIRDNNEFIEIYNNSDADHTVAAASGTGYGIAASDGVTRCTIPNGTVIPAGGHFLCVNSVGYGIGVIAGGWAAGPLPAGD